MNKSDLVINNLQWLICHKSQPNQIICLIYMYKEDLSLNNLHWLICHKSQPNKTKNNSRQVYMPLKSIKYIYILVPIYMGTM